MSTSALHAIPRRPAWAEISRAALIHNFSVVRSLIPSSVKVMAIVKANAYGHGAVECAKVLRSAGANLLGVAILQEAVELREAGITGPIVVLTPPMPEEAATYIAHDIAFTLVSRPTANIFSECAFAAGRTARAHLKIDTGMGRVGIPPGEAPLFLKDIATLGNIHVEGVATHFASSDDDLPLTQRQWESFMRVVDELKNSGMQFEYVHAANSGAIMHLPESAGTCVRPGLMLYGYAPDEDHALAPRLKPVLSLRAQIDFVKRVPEGTGISYGVRYVTNRETTIATVPIGYADGYTRRLTGKAVALFAGKRVRVAGTVCMDQIMLDVGDMPAHAGDTVTLIGDDGKERVTAWELASATGTIPYEILTGISARVPRLYV